MHKSAFPKVKICCISSVQEAQLAVQYGADALGLVGPMPSGPGTLTDDIIARILPSVPPPIATFLLTSETKAEAIIAHHKRVRTNTLQLVDALSEGTYADIRAALPAVKLVQVIRNTKWSPTINVGISDLRHRPVTKHGLSGQAADEVKLIRASASHFPA